jgi:hypothetical protein
VWGRPTLITGKACNVGVGELRPRSKEGDDLRGPVGWLNWQAARIGLPARESSAAGILVRALWEEYGLYSDARVIGELSVGPFDLVLAFPPDRPRIGYAQLELVLRVTDHLLNPEVGSGRVEHDVTAYTGGDVGDEFASLLSLALGCRLRSGGVVRRGLEGDPRGKPFFGTHRPPLLGAPTGLPMLPGIANEVRLEDAEALLNQYALLSGVDAVAVLRAAHQYADALWWADADPRIAWIKLFGALEAAANRWDAAELSDPVQQLRRRHPSMSSRLERDAPEALVIVATSISRILGAESKMIDFVLHHDPGPPQERPPFGQVDWTKLEGTLHRLYADRSADLHGGIPFPAPLCQPPIVAEKELPAEAFPALGASGGGGSWPANVLPMYLHTFAYIVRGSLHKWWTDLSGRDETKD